MFETLRSSPIIERLGSLLKKEAVSEGISRDEGGTPSTQEGGEKHNFRLSLKEKIFFLDSFAGLLNAGIPIVKSLQILYYQSENKHIRAIAEFLKSEIEKGLNIANTVTRIGHAFSAFDIAMIEMGEATGRLGQSIEAIAKKEEKSLELSRKIGQALIYPIAVVVVAIGMITIIMTYVIPKIEGIYKEANTDLPGLTKVVITISDLFCNYGVLALLGVIILGVLATFCLKIPAIRLTYDRFKLSIPVFWPLLKKQSLVTFSELLASLLASGITIHRALSIVENGLTNSLYVLAIQELSNDVKTGKWLSVWMGGEFTERKIRGETLSREESAEYARKISCFPIELATAVKVGEQTGTLSAMLAKTAERYNKEIDSLIKNLSSMLEPIVIIGLWSVVGFIVIAIMLPFFNMANVVH